MKYKKIQNRTLRCAPCLLTLYGINNIGKTTHTLRLVEKLKQEGFDVVRVKYPVYDVPPSGDFLNQALRSGKPQTISEQELQLWFVLNRWQFQPTIEQWLKQGKIVVAEDYIGTGIAWGTTKGVETSRLEILNEGLLKEDLAILLDGERFTEATEKGHLHETNNELIARCRTVHLELAQRYGWQKVEVQPNPDDTFARIWAYVEKKLQSEKK